MSGEEPRQPKDLKGLLKFCLEQTVAEDASSTHSLDPERRQFLEKVLAASQSLDPVKSLTQTTEILLSRIQEISTETATTESISDVVRLVDDGIIDIIGQGDFATDFFKIGGLDLIYKLLASPLIELQVKSFDIIAEAVQNNPSSQSVVLDTSLLSQMTSILNDESKEERLRVKALYAISCLIRENPMAADHFQTGFNGLHVLLRCLEASTESRKLRIKSSFVITSLIQSSGSFQDSFYRLGLLERLIAILKLDHDHSHEYVASALRALISANQKARDACFSAQHALVAHLNAKIDQLKDEEQFQDEINIYKDILQLESQSSTPVPAGGTMMSICQ